MKPGTLKILVVDDDPDIRKILCDRLQASGYHVLTAPSGDVALAKISQEEPDLVFLDLNLPNSDGMEVLKRLGDHPDLSVIIITAFGTIEKAVEAMRAGAFDFIPKPFSPEHLSLVIRKVLEYRALKQENTYLHGEVDAPYREIVGNSPHIREAIETARKVAAASSTVLMLGETGTGKEIFARSMHRWSPRSRAPFVVVNCVALRDELMESELFGHEKGAFTGAHQVKLGKLEIANGGTVFFDEIGDMKLELQAKLLRVLQGHDFERVGGTKRIEVDIRVIAATNRNLYQDVQTKRFRSDLFFRLNVMTLQLPPLRERREDIPLLAEFFLRRSCQAVKRPLMRITPVTLDHLASYEWPGNVRELGNVIERATVLAAGEEIQPEDLPLLSARGGPVVDDQDHPTYHEAIREHQRQVIQQALRKSGGNQAKAADLLGLQRTYLARLVKKLGLQRVT